MELLFFWISSFRNITNQGFNFSGTWQFEYDHNTDSIQVKDLENELPSDFFGSNILNASAIIGNNGVGKTELLHFLRAFPTNYHSPSIIILGKRPKKEGEVWELTISTHNSFEKKKQRINLTKFQKKISYIEITHGVGVNDPLHELLDKKVRIIYLNYGLSIRPGSSNSFSSDISTVNLLESLNNKSPQTISKLSILDQYRFDELERHCTFIKDDIYKKSVVLVDKRLDWVGMSFDNSMLETSGSADFIQKLNSHPKFKTYIKQLLRSSSNEKVGGTWLRISSLSIARIFLGVAICSKQNININFEINKLSLGDIQKKLLELIKSEFPESSEFYEYIYKLKSKLLQTEIKIDLNNKVYVDYIDLFTIQFRLKIEEAKNWIEKYRQTSFKSPLLSYYWNLSSGEAALLSHFSRLYSIRDKIVSKTVWLQIDEADIHLHPEWQLEFFNAYTDYLSNTFPEIEFQLFLATHSPFILSDIPKNHNVFLQRNKNGLCEVVYDVIEGETFGGNLHSLYRNTFFLKNGFIGKFAQNIINSVIRELNSNKTLDKKKSQYIKNVIFSIGEPIIRDRLIQMFEDKQLLDSDERLSTLEEKVDSLISKGKK